MKKRVLSALLVLCMACGLVSTAWAADGGQATRETAEKPGIMLLDAEGMDQQTPADPTATPSASPAADPTATPAPTAEPTATPSATPDATEAPDATATPAPENSETAENETDAAEPTATPTAAPDEAEPVEYTAALEQDGQALNVVVNAPAGAFGEDVQPTLNVTAIEDETQAADIEAKLAENDIEYDGFAALDISFTDADGNEIEPSEPVTVRIELPDSIIDSGIDLNTLAVQHFAEDEAGNVTSVDQVASVADNTIVLSDEAKAAMEAQAAENAADPESTEEAGPAPMMLAPAANNALTTDNGEAEETEAPVVAEFEVDGFSTFTITWDAYYRQQSFDVTCYYANQQNQPLPNNAKPSDFSVNNGTTINLTQDNHDSRVNINGYIFDHAEYRTNNYSDWQTLTSLRTNYESGGWIQESKWHYYCNGREVGSKPSIRLYYNEIPDLDTIQTVDSASNGVRISLFDYHHKDNNTVDDYISTQLGNFVWDGTGTGNWNQWVSGNGVFQGILKNTVDPETELPVFENGRGSDFSWLFTESNDTARDDWGNTHDARTYYGNLNHLFSADEYNSTGYYEYDSSKNFATLEDDGNFKVYNLPYQPGNSDASVPKFLPLNDLNGNANTLDGNINYYFGMNVNFEFVQPQNGMANWNETESPMRFEFTGDDDLWVFIDGVLVLDMGGVHDAQQGSIDFSTGEVWVSKVWNGDEQTKSLEEIFREALGDEWVADNMTNGRFNDYSAHTFELYYMERGAGGSNCRMRFNIQSVPAGTIAVNKQVNSGASAEQKAATYQMQLLVQNEEGNFVTPSEAIANYSDSENTFTIGNSLDATGQDDALPGDGTFTVTGGNSVYIHNIPLSTVYKIKELNVNNDTSTVQINNETATITDGTAETQESFTVGRTNAVTVYNRFPVAPPDDFDITTGKRADLNDDGTYDLTLTTSGDIATVQGEKIQANILFIVDRSTSMWDDYRDYGRYEESKSRMDVLKEAITGLVTEIESNEFIDASYNMVQFGSDDYNKKLLGENGWTDESSAISQALNSIQETYYEEILGSGVGTNYQAGIKLAKEELQYVDGNAKTYVIFLTDGDPTYHYTENGSETGGGSYTEDADIENAVEEIQGLSCDNFYAIGVSDDYTKDNLDRLCGKSEEHPGTGVDATVAQVYGATEDGDLPEIFDSIISEMTFFAAENVVMHDTLSQWAVAADDNVQFTVTLEHRTYNDDGSERWTAVAPEGNGNTVVNSGGSVHYKTQTTNDEGNEISTDVYIIPSYDIANKTITVQLADNENGNSEENPSAYKLAPDYRYSVTMKIKPSTEAIKAGMSSENAQKIPDANTGTHSEKNPMELGFYSNEEGAKVTYTVGEEDRKKEFPKPVIQVQETGDLTIDKVISGPSSGTDYTGQDFTFTITTTDKSVYDNQPEDGYTTSVENQKAVFAADTGANDEPTGSYSATVTVNGEGEITINNLPAVSYTIAEQMKEGNSLPDIGDYHFVNVEYTVGKEVTSTATVPTGGSVKITATNNYEHKDVKLIVNKTVAGTMGDTTNNSEFTFHLTLTKAGSADSVNAGALDYTVNAEPQTAMNYQPTGYYTFTLSHGETAEIQIPYGYTAKLEEVEGNGYVIYSRRRGENDTEITGNLTDENLDSTLTSQHFNNNNVVTSIDMTQDQECDFVNFRPVVPPTGLESNHTKPYALMVTAAGVAGLALIGAVVNRRIRRRREE